MIDRLQAAWSPEPIAGRLQIVSESPGNFTQETIYAFVYSPHGKALGRYLPMARHQRRTWYARKPRGLTIPLENIVEQRPPEIGAHQLWALEGRPNRLRQEFCEANLTSLVERQSRYTILARNSDRNATGVVAGVMSKLKALPASARRSITFDRGTRFARYGLLKAGSGWRAISTSHRRRGRRARWRTPMAGFGPSDQAVPLCTLLPCWRE